MAVTVESVIGPGGIIEPSIIWPGKTATWVDAKVQAFITDAESRTEDAEDPDAATLIWVKYRAKVEQYERMIGTPASATDSDEGSRQYTDAQIEAVGRERDALLAEFEDLIDEVADEDEYDIITSLRDEGSG